jgi:TRAP-type C4-dicarboxylate transport system permease small subunit
MTRNDAIRSSAGRFVAGVRKLITGLVVFFFVYMAVAVLVQIAGRYVFDYSIDWTAETATFAQIWMILLAAGLAMQRNLHVSVDALTNVLPVPILRFLIIVVAIPCVWFLWQAIVGSLALIDIGRIQASPVLQVPMWIPYLSLPIGLAYFGLELLLALASKWQDPRQDRFAK